MTNTNLGDGPMWDDRFDERNQAQMHFVKLKPHVFEYRYRYSTGVYEVRLRTGVKPLSFTNWKPMPEFTGQTGQQFKEFMEQQFGVRLLAARDVE